MSIKATKSAVRNKSRVHLRQISPSLYAITSLLIACGGVCPFFPALAQESATSGSTAEQDRSKIEEIVVTSRKREEKLQDVPLSITALTSQDIADAGVQDLRDVTLLTPGLTYTANGAQAFAKPTIRGQTDIGGNFSENNVPVFLDGIYISNSSAIDFGLVDIARIEVIEGPVSATYGRSAYAGAINYVTAKPGATPSADLEFTTGDYTRENVRAKASGPIIPGLLSGGISGSYDTFDGTRHDSVTNQNAGGYDRKDVMANLIFTPDEHIEIRPAMYYGSDFFASPATKIGVANCGQVYTGSYNQTYCGNVPGPNFQGPYIAAPGDYGTTGNERNVLSTSLSATGSYDWGTIVSLTGYNNIRSTSYNEFDNLDFGVPVATYYLPPGGILYTTPANGAAFAGTPTGNTVNEPVHFGYVTRERDFSEELRYRSPSDFFVRGSAGVYFDNSLRTQDLTLAVSSENVPTGQYILNLFAVPPGVSKSGQHNLSTQQDTTYAVFAGGDVDIFKDLTASTEVRANSTKSVFNQLGAIGVPFGEGYSTAPASAISYASPEQHTFNSITSRNTVSYKISPEALLYFSAANGEKPGGFNTTATPATQTFNPETNWTYEFGEKSTWFKNRLQINADVFHIDAQNYQVSAPASDSVLGNFVTRNFGSLSTNGFEMSATVRPLDGVKWVNGISYTDPKFGSDSYDFSDVATCSGTPSCAGRITTVGVNQAVNLKGLRPPYESNLQFNTAMQLDYPLNDFLNWTARLDYRYEGKQFYQYPADFGSYGPSNNLNLHAGVLTEKWSIIAYVKNVTNDQTPVTVQDEASTGAIPTFFESGYYPVAVLPDGRTFGVTLKYHFGN